jgi:ankyrin repeat protein
MLDSDEDDLGFDDDVLIFESDKPDFSVTDRYTHKPGMPDPAQFNIFSACKAGDLFRVRVLIEEHDVDVNRKDEFDSIPLFYACLCGHANIVKYLLDRGARLDAGTFEGARCFVSFDVFRIRGF